ncbi:MAG: phosphate signaling complex protein PhoU [Lachnoclostridium edouardi]|uniref:phosphate signaling complex protein PhoU n=1 Tax=Lachnoclostridium edouardi TaxID=1926283 RepID=UPI0026DD8A84|nr:phosphate signaling complex protein PhoU [Lachnoclostridium edouardi]MDO4279277.1 phosphate signaling complex protein PhoU [Lachnoclostridium edouardi]
MTTRSSFDNELQELNKSLEEMSLMAERAIEKSLEALQNNDSELAKEIIKGDRAVDNMERTIETRCLSLMLRQQPVASDLRHISTALKVVTDLERIGDHAADISELTLNLNGEEECRVIAHLPEMADHVRAMLRTAISAFINRDIQTAKEVEEMDDVIDQLFDKAKEEVVQLLREDGSKSDKAIDFLMIAKYLERIGDHAVNVCEWTEFSVTGAVNNIRIL